MRGVLAWTIAVVACGSDHAGAIVDAPLPPPPHDGGSNARCDATAPFGSAINLGSAVNTSLNEATPRLSPDELTMVFSRLNPDNTWDIWEVTRASISDAFGAPTVLGTINSVYTDVWPTLSPNELTIYFNSNRAAPTTGPQEVYTATRTSPTADFSPPTLVSGLMGGDNQPYVSPSGTSLYFSSASRPDTTGGGDLYRAPIDGSGNIGPVSILIGAVNTPAYEQCPVVTQDELTIYYCRSNGIDNDIYVATRASASAPWAAGSAVPNFANQGSAAVPIEEVPGWVSPDGCDLYFYDNGSNMPGAQGLDDLYEIARPATSQ